MEEPKRAAPRWFLAIRRPCKLRRHASRWRCCRRAQSQRHKPAESRFAHPPVGGSHKSVPRQFQLVKVGKTEHDFSMPSCSCRVAWKSGFWVLPLQIYFIEILETCPSLIEIQDFPKEIWKNLCRILKDWPWKAHLWSFHCFSILVHHTYLDLFRQSQEAPNALSEMSKCRKGHFTVSSSFATACPAKPMS